MKNEKQVTYDVDYFIKKFEVIPDELWYIGDFQNIDGSKHCAMGHCGRGSEIANALCFLGMDYGISFPSVNDATYENCASDENDSKFWNLDTPKQRVLSALNYIKSQQQPAPKPEKIVYKTRLVTVDVPITLLEGALNNEQN